MAPPIAHKPYRVLAALSLALALVPLCLPRTAPDPVQLAGAYQGWALALYMAAVVATAQVLFSFGPGDPQRAGWALLSGCFLALFCARLLAGPNPSGLHDAPVPGVVLTSSASVLSSALGMAAYLVLARAWRRSGLDTAGAASRAVSTAIGVAIAAALAGPDLVARLPDALRGDLMAGADVATDVLDGAIFVVSIPVLRAAMTLGGGVVGWPWLLLTGSVAGWLGYDALSVWGSAVGLSPRAARVGEEIFRTWACCSAFAAATAQRWVMNRAPGAEQAAAGPGAP